LLVVFAPVSLRYRSTFHHVYTCSVAFDMGKNRNHKRRSRRRGGAESQLLKAIGPPPFKVNPRIQRFRMRFDATADLPASIITYGDIATLMAMKSGDTGDDGIIMMWEAVRLREVHVWGPALINSTNNQLGIEFSANYAVNAAPSNNASFIEGVDTTRTNDSSTSNTGSSHVTKRPTGLAASWINAGSIMIPGTDTYNAAGLQNMFTITCPQYSVIDLILDCVWSDGTFPVVYISTGSTALPAGTYALGLAYASGSAHIVPQDYNAYD
jgi:hypothetical protein